MNQRKKASILLCTLLAALPAAALEGGMTGNTPGAVQSNTALPFLKVDFDIENNPGWQAIVKGGYQWKLFRHVGYTVSSNGTSHTKTHGRTKSGAAASLGFAYNFGNQFPLTLGVGVGMSPGSSLNTRSSFNDGVNDVTVNARQKVRLYDLDLSVNYDFKKSGCWTPFAGVVGGLTYTTNKGRISLDDGTGPVAGRFNNTHRINVVGGATVGSKWRLNECVTLSLYSTYAYLGTIREKEFAFNSGAYAARTSKIRVHQVDVKAGLKIQF